MSDKSNGNKLAKLEKGSLTKIFLKNSDRRVILAFRFNFQLSSVLSSNLGLMTVLRL